MSGAEAVASSFRDLRSHLTALSGAARSAITNTLATLDPAAIDEESARKSGLFSTGRAAGSWKQYRMLHKALLQSSEADANLALVTALRAADAAAKEKTEASAKPGKAR
jgi:predicted component of type VI protein secretion system